MRMTAGELKVLVDNLISLQGKDAEVFRDDSRDGDHQLTDIHGELKKIGGQMDQQIMLVLR